MIILKLGGSVITRKEAEKPTIDHDNLERIAQEIAQVKNQKLLLVHGAGSYGHPYARKYGIGKEINTVKDLKERMWGFTVTQHAVKELNNRVCEYLQRQGVFAVSLQPSSFITTKNKRIETADLTIIRQYLELDFVPVLYGDVVLDNNQNLKMAVLSGDQIVKYLAINLKPNRVILATDVDGIYDRDPKKHADACLLEVVSSPENLQTGKAGTVDVTGGMGGKVAELLSLADRGIESEIINANHANIIKKALQGEKVTGTLIKKK